MTKHNRGLINEIGGARGSFAVAFFLSFVLCVAFLAAADALPEVPSINSEVRALFEQQNETALPADMELQSPLRVEARAASLDVSVSNPDSSDIATLDKALLKGAIRHPSSAYLGQKGTVVLFGHSSGLPIVHNQNYKAFNDIQNLKDGNIISVYADTREYRYKVTDVRLVDTTDADEALVSLRNDGMFLTLVTCNNSFGTKTSRYVVEAEFVEVHPISN